MKKKLPIILMLCLGQRILSEQINLDEFRDNFVHEFEEIRVKADPPITREEVFYLTNLLIKKAYTTHDLKLSRAQLELKRQILKSQYLINTKTKSLTITIETGWLLKRVTIKGVLLERFKYADLYAVKHGSLFDLKLHDDSIEQIKHYLKSQGYLNCIVEDSINRNAKERSITIDIVITLNQRIRLKNISFSSQEESPTFKKVIKKLEKSFHLKKKTLYTKTSYESWREKILKIAAEENFFFCDLTSSLKLNQKKTIGTLTWTIKQKVPQIFTVGNHFFSTKDLIENFKQSHSKQRAFDQNQFIDSIRKQYIENGYFKTTIECDKADNQFVFTINEHAPVFFSTVMIVDEHGNIESKNTSSTTKNLIASKKNIAYFLKTVSDDFERQSFWDAKILNHKLSSINGGQKFQLMINIHRGLRHFQGAITTSFPPLEPILKKYALSKAIPFNYSHLFKQQIACKEYLNSLGYWNCQVTPAFTFIPVKRGLLVNTEWKVALHEKITTGKLIIQGATKVSLKRLLKIANIETGSAWQWQTLNQIRNNLNQTNIFEHVTLSPLAQKESPAQLKHISAVLFDTLPSELRIKGALMLTGDGAVSSKIFNAKIQTNYTIKNPTGIADKIDFSMNADKFSQRLQGEYSIAGTDFFNSNISIRGKIKNISVLHNLNDTTPSYETMSASLLCEIDYAQTSSPISCVIKGGLMGLATSHLYGNVDYEKRKISDFPTYIIMEPKWAFNSVKNHLKQDLAVSHSIATTLYIPLEKNVPPLIKATTGHSMCIDISPLLNLNIILKMGWMSARHFAHINPALRFYLGGAQSVRGYVEDAVPPIGVYTVTTPNKGREKDVYTIQGGTRMINSQVEFHIKTSEKMSLVLFQDTGALFKGSFKEFVNKFYQTYGCGIRYQTPVGTLKFDLGLKTKLTYPNEPIYNWHLSFGKQF